ncbi:MULTISPECIES: hypothetical protein [Sutcliffiella]|nr:MULTISPECIES: hypothetical protein [Sutcliffiella]MED4018695.1 hypothetical protein [Sutcliffiella cohnii]WBL13107.1 hypothetical protein O1A01_14305 [Sutcliffiella sp. NC1]
MCLLVSGCFSASVEKDITEYVNEGLLPLADLEEEAIDLFDSVVGYNYTDDYTLYDTLNLEVIPRYQKLLNELEKLKPNTEEVQQVHDIYVSGAKKQYEAMMLILDGIEFQDVSIIEEANLRLAEGRTIIREFQIKLDALIEEYELEMEVDYEVEMY